MLERHIVHQDSVSLNAAGYPRTVEFCGRYDPEMNLMDVNIVVLIGKVHEFPHFLDRHVAGSERQADGGAHRVKGRDILESARHGCPAFVEFFVPQTESVRIVHRDIEEDPSTMTGRQCVTRRIDAARCVSGVEAGRKRGGRL